MPLADLLNLLRGKKTYLVVIGLFAVLFGVWQKWWQVPDEMYFAMMGAALFFLRHAVGTETSKSFRIISTSPVTAAVAKTGPILALTAVLIAGTGCAIFSKTATLEDKLVETEDLAYSAASIGTVTTLEFQPQYRPAFELARNELDRQLRGNVLTLESLRAVLATLPVDELRSDTARIVVGSATRLFRRAVGQETEQNVQLYLRAVATGIRDGFNAALGPPAASQLP